MILKGCKAVIILCFFIISSVNLTYSQEFNTGLFTHNFPSDRYIRFSYDNDYFAKDDDDYTQGVNLEVVLPVFRKNPLNKLLFSLAQPQNKYGLAFEHATFTSHTISLPDIQYGQRPFAATFFLKSFRISDQLEKKLRLNTSFWLGVIGPGAFGQNGQVWIHELTDNWEPRGWRNQIENDVIINYSATLEKTLLSIADYVNLYGESKLRLGTLYSDISLGSSVIIGLLNSHLSPGSQEGKLKLNLFGRITGKAVGYNATLQGGLFNKSSPYTISAEGVDRFVGQYQFGLNLQFGSLYLEYYRSFISREFKTGTPEAWGGLRIGVGL